MRTLLFAFVSVTVIVWLVSASRGEPPLAPESPPTGALAEPTNGAPVQPELGDETEAKDPFAPYEIGPPEAAWSYKQLTADEQQVADRGRTQPGWKATHDLYRAAVIQRAAEARAAAAASQLGATHLDTMGVVP